MWWIENRQSDRLDFACCATLRARLQIRSTEIARFFQDYRSRERRSVKRKGKKMSDAAIVGNSAIHKKFLDSHVPFLIEFGELQKLADKIFRMTLEKYNRPVEKEPEGAELEELTALRLAQIIVFYLVRAAHDGFSDVFVLAGNCRGFAAKMMLRMMYEHLVTASFIALKPEQAKLFDESAANQKWKVWEKTLQAVPAAKGTVPAGEIQKLDEQQQKVKGRIKTKKCKECGHVEIRDAWTRVDVVTMSQQVDTAKRSKSLENLYAPCYLMPTALMHPTPVGLELRLEKTDEGFVYNDMPEAQAHDSLLRAHGLVLRLFKLMNEYFALGLNVELDARWAAFPKIWGGALVDPPAETDQEGPEGQQTQTSELTS